MRGAPRGVMPECHHRGAALLVTLAIVATGAAVRPARAQSDAAEPPAGAAESAEPADPGEEPEPVADYPADARQSPKANLFSLQRLDAAIELAGQYERRRVRTGGLYGLAPFTRTITRQTNSWRAFDEQIILELDSTVYDPRLLRVAGSIGLGLTQQRYTETFERRRDAESNDGYLSTYDLRLDFLPGKTISGSAYALRTLDRFARPFLPSLRELRSDYGFALYYANDKLPMQLTYDHRDVERDGSRRRLDKEDLSEDLLRYQATWITSQTHSLRLGYEYANNQERYSGSRYEFRNTRHQWRIDDEILFGSQRQHRVDTVLRWQDETGDYARDLLELGTRLSLRHTDTLSTSYQYQFQREETGQLRFDTHRGDWLLFHQPTENFSSTYNLFGVAQSVDPDIDSTELGASANWSYTRPNRWGRATANLALAHESERVDGSGTRPVFNESASFIDPLPVTLSRPDVVPSSIVVRDAGRFRVFVPGSDYFITRVADRTMLLRNPLGRIRNLSTVYVDYLYRVESGLSRDTQTVNLGLSQEFNSGWTPYYLFDFRADDRDWPTPYPGVRDFEQNRHRVGVRYRKDRLSAGTEFELLKDPIDPFHAYRLFGAWSAYRAAGRSLDLRADFGHYFFETASRGDSMLLDLSMDARAQLNRQWEGYLTASYRYEYDGTRGRGKIHGVDVESGVAYRWGQLTVTASIEYDLLDIVASDEEGFGVWLKVRRDFPNLLGRLR